MKNGHLPFPEKTELQVAEKKRLLMVTVIRDDSRWEISLPMHDSLIASCCERIFHDSALKEHKGILSTTVLLTNDDYVQDLNLKYRQKNKPTNVLSFPQEEHLMQHFKTLPKNREVPIGDIALAFETLQREAKSQNKSLSSHFSHLVLHGFLHLLGYDHQTEQDAKIMESLEITILKRLKIENPYQLPAHD